jgi:uncharacterized protein YjaG (DUF416 family)
MGNVRLLVNFKNNEVAFNNLDRQWFMFKLICWLKIQEVRRVSDLVAEIREQKNNINLTFTKGRN